MKKIFKTIGKILGIIGVGILTGLLGAIGGADKTPKAIRRYGISVSLLIIVNIILFFQGLWTPWLLLIMVLTGALSLGYGVPAEDGSDEGSSTGQFWYKITKGSHFWTDIFTRGSISLLKCLPAIPIVYARGVWGLYFIVAPIMILNDLIFGAIFQKQGSFKIFGLEVTWNEFLRFCGTGVGYITLTLL